MVPPDEKPKDGNGHTRTGDEFISEYRFASEGGDQFTDNAHGGQNHDVNDWVRIKPEEMLEENRIAAERRIEETEMEDAFQSNERKGDGDHGSCENEDDTGAIEGPDKKRQAEPSQARSAHGVDSDYKVEAGKDRRKSVDKNADNSGCNGGIRINTAEWCVKGPASIQTSCREGVQHKAAPDDVQAPA